MICAWQELLSVLPARLRSEVDRCGKDSMQELRLRINAPPELVMGDESHWLSGNVTQSELRFVVNAASLYSPWSVSTTAHGFLSAAGGHRIGLCGEVICKDGEIAGFREVYSLCIRVARDVPGIAKKVPVKGSVLILGAPGWGKTTLLRDLIRQIGQKEIVCAIDERGELFPKGFETGKRIDVLTGCPKPAGMDMALRTMGPDWIAADEITAESDCNALLRVTNCGVRLAVTAHASSIKDFYNRKAYRRLADKRIFETLLVLRKDKSYSVERMAL